MQKVLIYSLLLIAGLIGSQVLPHHRTVHFPIVGSVDPIALATMAALAFIMIHVGYEFEIDKANPRRYAWDSFVAMTAATLPWLFCALYFVFVMEPRTEWFTAGAWRGALLRGLFAAPTSAGVLFSMLAAAGLGATWLFQKARILAIFDDLGVILLLIPLKIMLDGFHWELAVVVALMVGLLWMAWRYLHAARLPVNWPFVIGYGIAITAASELIHHYSSIHIEVLLPAFAVGCVLARPPGAQPHADDALEGVEEGPESPQEQRVSTIVSACFMVLVGLSMPSLFATPAAERAAAGPGWGTIALHVLAITVLSNVGKLFPLLCYRREASVRERLALAIGLFPRGEVGAGVLVLSLKYNYGGPALTVAVLSLALNLLGTGLFIVIVKRLLSAGAGGASATVSRPT